MYLHSLRRIRKGSRFLENLRCCFWLLCSQQACAKLNEKIGSVGRIYVNGSAVLSFRFLEVILKRGDSSNRDHVVRRRRFSSGGHLADQFFGKGHIAKM